MATTYTLADDDVKDRLAGVMAAYHDDLARSGVRVGVLVAWNAEGDAVTHGGYPAQASVRVVPLRDRMTKGIDAELLLDGANWARLSARHRDALLDHELGHLALAKVTVRDPKDGSAAGWATDDLGRPRLRLRKGDWNAGDGFAAVCARHGEFAPEFGNLAGAYARAKAARDAGAAERAA